MLEFQQSWTFRQGLLPTEVYRGENSTINDEKGSENETYQLNIWKIKLSQNVPKFNIPNKYYFKKHLFINKL